MRGTTVYYGGNEEEEKAARAFGGGEGLNRGKGRYAHGFGPYKQFISQRRGKGEHRPPPR